MYLSSFLNVDNASFINDLYDLYLIDSNEVDESWRHFFQSLSRDDIPFIHDMISGVRIIPNFNSASAEIKDYSVKRIEKDLSNSVSDQEVSNRIIDTSRILKLVYSYRNWGHLGANLDPLGIDIRSLHPDLIPENYGFTTEDYSRDIFVNGILGYDYVNLTTILDKLRDIYCRNIGVEFMHIQDLEQVSWIRNKLEVEEKKILSVAEKKKVLSFLIRAEVFEKFLHLKYPGAKRFGLDGAESLIPSLKYCLETSAHLGVEEIMLGMPHRGRLNVLTNILNKPFRAVFFRIPR